MTNINRSYVNSTLSLALGPIIETMMQWKALIAFGTTTLASTICYCLNFQQGVKRNENPRPKLMSSKDITGKKNHWTNDTKKDYTFIFRK